MINWDVFENNLKEYIDNNIAQNSLEFSNYFAELYYNTIISGTDQYNNSILLADKKTLAMSMYMLLSKIKDKKSPIDITIDLNNVFKLFWSTVIMNIDGMIPGTLSNVSNTIINYGNGGQIILNNDRTSDFFIKNLTLFCKVFTSSISGTVLAIQTNGTSTPFPWVGIK